MISKSVERRLKAQGVARVGLTDEEMKALRPDVPVCGQTVFDCNGCSGGCPIVAKAQLKKMVEWLLDNELHPECEGLELSGKSFLALLEEIK